MISYFSFGFPLLFVFLFLSCVSMSTFPSLFVFSFFQFPFFLLRIAFTRFFFTPSLALACLLVTPLLPHVHGLYVLSSFYFLLFLLLFLLVLAFLLPFPASWSGLPLTLLVTTSHSFAFSSYVLSSPSLSSFYSCPVLNLVLCLIFHLLFLVLFVFFLLLVLISFLFRLVFLLVL